MLGGVNTGKSQGQQEKELGKDDKKKLVEGVKEDAKEQLKNRVELEEEDKDLKEKRKNRLQSAVSPVPSIIISSQPASSEEQASPVRTNNGATPSLPPIGESEQFSGATLLSPIASQPESFAEPQPEVPADKAPPHIFAFRETVRYLLTYVRLIESASPGFEMGLEVILDYPWPTKTQEEENKRKLAGEAFRELKNPILALAESGLFRNFISTLNQEIYGSPSAAQYPITDESIAAIDDKLSEDGKKIIEKGKVTDKNFLKLITALYDELRQPDFFWNVLVQLVKFGKLSSSDFSHNDGVSYHESVKSFFNGIDPVIDSRLHDSITPLPTEILWSRGYVGDYLTKTKVVDRSGKVSFVPKQHTSPYYNEVTYVVNVQLLNRLTQTLDSCLSKFPECKPGSTDYDISVQLKALRDLATDHLSALNIAKRVVSRSDIKKEEKILRIIQRIHQTKCRVEEAEKTPEEIDKEIVLANLLTYVSIRRGTRKGIPLKNQHLKGKIARLEEKLLQFYLSAKEDPIANLKDYLAGTIQEIQKLPREISSLEEGQKLLKDLENLKGLIDHPKNKYFLEDSLGVIDHEDTVNPEHMIIKHIIQRVLTLFVNPPFTIDEINKLDHDEIQAIYDIREALNKYYEDPRFLFEKNESSAHGLDNNIINVIIGIIWLKKPMNISYESNGSYNRLLKIVAKRLFVFYGKNNFEEHTEESIYKLFFSKPHHELTPERPIRRPFATVSMPASQMKENLLRQAREASLRRSLRNSLPKASRGPDDGSSVGDEVSASGGVVQVAASSDVAVVPPGSPAREKDEGAFHPDNVAAASPVASASADPVGASPASPAREKDEYVLHPDGVAAASPVASASSDPGVAPTASPAKEKEKEEVEPIAIHEVASKENPARDELAFRPDDGEAILSPRGNGLATPRRRKGIRKLPADGDSRLPLSPRPRAVNFTPTKSSLSTQDINAKKSKIIGLRLLQLVEEHRSGWSEISYLIADIAKTIHANHLHDGEKYAVGMLNKLKVNDALWQIKIKDLLDAIPKLKDMSNEEEMEKVLGLHRNKVGSIEYDAWIKSYERNEDEEEEVKFKIFLALFIQIFDLANNPERHHELYPDSKSFAQVFGHIKTYRKELSAIVGYGVELLHSRSYFSLKRFMHFIRTTFLKGNWKNDPEKKNNPIFLDLDALVNSGKPGVDEPDVGELVDGNKLRLPDYLYKMSGEQSTKFLYEHPVVGFVAESNKVAPQSKGVPIPAAANNVVAQSSVVPVVVAPDNVAPQSSVVPVVVAPDNAAAQLNVVAIPAKPNNAATQTYKRESTILLLNLIKVLDIVLRNTQGKLFIKTFNENEEDDDKKLKKYKTNKAILENAQILHNILTAEMNHNTPIAKITKRVNQFVLAMRKDNQILGREKLGPWEWGSELAESLAYITSQYGGELVVNFSSRVLTQVIDLKVSRDEALEYLSNHQLRAYRELKDGQGSHSSLKNVSQGKEVILNNNLNEKFLEKLARMVTVSTAHTRRRSQHGMDNPNNTKFPLNAPHQDIVADAAKDAMRAYVTSVTRLPSSVVQVQLGKSLKTRVANMRSFFFFPADHNMKRYLANFSEDARWGHLSAKARSSKVPSPAPEKGYAQELNTVALLQRWEAEIVMLQAIVDRAKTYVEKGRELLGNGNSHVEIKQKDFMRALYRDFSDVYERLKEDKTKNICKRAILTSGGIVPYLRDIIMTRTHFGDTFNSILAKGECGKMLNNLEDFLNYISNPPETPFVPRTFTPG